MSDDIKIQSKNKKVWFIIAITAVVIAVLTIVAVVLISSNSATVIGGLVLWATRKVSLMRRELITTHFTLIYMEI